MEVTSLELSSATREQRVARLQRLSAEALERHAAAAAAQRDPDSLWEIVEAHLTLLGDREAPLSLHTARAYRRGIEELLAMWGSEDLLAPGPGAGAAYLRRLQAGDREPVVDAQPRGRRGRRVKRGPVSQATVAVRLASARALYDALRWAGATDADPFRDVRVPPAARPAPGEPASPRVYTEIELGELLAAARDAHERVLVLLGAHAGLRVSEMLRLRWEDVDLRTGALRVRADATAGEAGAADAAEVILSPRLSAELGVYRHELEADERQRHRAAVLELRSQYGVYARLRRLCLRAQVEFKGVHALRHAAGARLYHQTHDVAVVQEHLRHKALDMARRYADPDRVRLRGSLEEWE